MADTPITIEDAPLRPSTFDSLRVRNFRLFFSGQLISQIGNWLTLIAQALLVLKLTDSGFALGLLAACQFGPVLVLGAWAGLVADRSDKRKLLMIVQSFAMVQSFALAFIAFMHHPPVMAIYVVAVLGGIATAFDNPARRAYVVEMVPEANVQNAVSLNSALMTGSRVVGPALAGLLITTVGYGWTFAVDGVSYLAVILGLFMMRTSENRPHLVTPRGKGQVREGLRYVRTIPELFVPLVMTALIGTFAFNFQTVMPLLVKRTLHGTDRTFTLIYSVISIGSLAGALMSARRSTVSVRHIVVVCICLRCIDVDARSHSQCAIGLSHRSSRRDLQRHVHDHVDVDRAVACRPLDARSGSGIAGDGHSRHHTHRRPDPRLRLSTLRSQKRGRDRRHRSNRCRRVRNACGPDEGASRRQDVCRGVGPSVRRTLSLAAPTGLHRQATAHP